MGFIGDWGPIKTEKNGRTHEIVFCLFWLNSQIKISDRTDRRQFVQAGYFFNIYFRAAGGDGRGAKGIYGGPRPDLSNLTQ